MTTELTRFLQDEGAYVDVIVPVGCAHDGTEAAGFLRDWIEDASAEEINEAFGTQVVDPNDTQDDDDAGDGGYGDGNGCDADVDVGNDDAIDDGCDFGNGVDYGRDLDQDTEYGTTGGGLVPSPVSRAFVRLIAHS